MESIENNPAILQIKAVLREIFLDILGAVGDTFSAFYEWLRNVPIPVPPPMLKLFSNNKANLIIFLAVLVYAIVINAAAFIMFKSDKRRAIEKTERIPEKKLFRYMYLGGAAGAGLAMLVYRHKTQHKNFTITAIVLLFVQLLLFSFLLGFLGFWTFF